MDTTAIEGVIAVFVPLLIALLKQTGFPNSYNAVIAVVVYVLFGVLGVAVSGQAIDVNNLVPTIGIFTTVGTAAYFAFWRNVGEPQLTERTSAVK